MKTIVLLLSLLMPSILVAKEVSVSVGDKRLHGDFTAAEGDDSERAVFIISGSGPTDRDGNTVGAFGKNNSLKYLSVSLNKAGFTTLRVDKRGVAASANAAVKESDLRFSTYVDDAKHWVNYLKKQGYTDVTLVGHSEGALVATQAALSKPVKRLVCIAGAGRPAPDVLREQLKSKVPEPLYVYSDEVITSLTKGEEVANIHLTVYSLFRPSVQPYLISWFQIDPAKAIAKVQKPVLIIQGSTDIQTSVSDARLLHAAAKDSELLIVGGMNHVLKQVEGSLSEQLPSYSNSKLPLHPELVPNLIRFLEKE